MFAVFQFIRKQWISLLLLGAVIFGTAWVVQNKRPRGSMSVIEAQAMDMTLMKAPTGTYSVGTDYALERPVGTSSLFPATIQAQNDEDVVARVPGLLVKLFVYPGDKVRAGQVLGKLEAKELSSMAAAESISASASRFRAGAASSMAQQERAALSRAKAEAVATASRLQRAKAMLKAANSKIDAAKNDVAKSDAEIAEAEADLTLAETTLAREKELFKGGAISRQELEEAVRNRDGTIARKARALAESGQSKSELVAQRAELESAEAEVAIERQMLAAAQAEVLEASARSESARQQASAEQTEAGATAARAGSAGAMSSYTELRALSDGVVAERAVSPGTPVMPGDVVLRVKSSGKIRVQADLSQSYFEKVRLGSIARIRKDDMILDSRITAVFPLVDDRSRTFRVEALVDQPEGNWTPGSYVELEVFVDSPARVLSVPNEAIKTANDRSAYVWVVKKGTAKGQKDAEYTCTMHPDVSKQGPGICPICKMDLVPRDARGSTFVERRIVKIGMRDSSYTQVLFGLAAGDQVTVRGDTELFPGAAIEPLSVSAFEQGSTEPQPRKQGESEHNHKSHTTMESKTPNAGGKVAAQYTCPMHPEVVSDKPGTCPICKMDLELKKGKGTE